MATYALYTASFGASYANTPVKIFDTVTQEPAIVMASATSGVVNRLGIATLDSSGNLSVYLDSSRTWQVDTYPIPGSTVSSSNTQESTQLLVKTAVQTIATNTAGGGTGATAAKQDTGNASLATLVTNSPALGQAAMAGSIPVTIASNQSTVPISGSVSTTPATDVTATGTLSALSAAVTITGLNGASTLTFSITGTYSGLLTTQVQVDGTNWVTVPIVSVTNQSIPATSAPNGGTGVFTSPIAGANAVRVIFASYSSGSAVLFLRVTSITESTIGQAQPVNIFTVAGQTALATTSPGGTVGNGMVVALASSTIQAAYSAVSVVTSAKTGLSTIVEVSGIGTVCSFFINLTVFNAGSSTGLDLFLQWSPDGATNWIDLWQVEAFTAAGTAYIPPIFIPGRWRFAYQNRTGAATTATLTITATRLNMAPGTNVRQWFDRTAGVLSGTASAVTAWYDVAGCSSVSAFLSLGVATGPATYQLQFSADGVNALPANSPLIAVASTTTAYVATAGLSARFVRLAVTTAATSQTASTLPVTFTGV